MRPIVTLLACCLFSIGAIAQISFTDRTDLLTDPTHYSGNAVTIHDVNGDGLDDLIILDDAKDLRIEFQHLDGTWTSYSGGQMDNSNAWGMVVADMNNNGYADIFSGVNGGSPDYAQANSDGTAWNISGLSGYSLFYQGSSIGDVDNDGDLDLFVCADTDESAIWANDGNGNMTFSGTDLIDLTVNGWDGSGNYGSTFTDFDLDGDLDLYVAHCRQGVTNASDSRRINQLFENDGNNNYTENAAAYGLAIGAQSWTADFGDIDNDGDFDILLTNHDVNNMILENLDDSDQYQDIFDSAIDNQDVGLPIQGAFKDFDNDGFLDLIITGSSHALYHNNGDKTFTLVANPFPGADMESLAVGDLNHDGFLDIYASYANIYNSPSNDPDVVWMNEGNDNNFITVVLEGTVSNVDAIGTVVRAYGDWGVQVREVRAGESYGINHSLHTHFGLGTSTEIDSLVIDWPTSGIHQVIASPSANQFLAVVEGECIAPEAIVSYDGPAVICPGEMVTLDAGSNPNWSYAWSTGEVTSSIVASAAGVYMVSVTDMASGCTATSASIEVLLSPDETPNITVSGNLVFCEGGSVQLSSSTADTYMWSTGAETQSIEVTEAGDYSVSISGTCDSWVSEVVMVMTEATPEVVTESSVTIPAPGEADLTASSTGDEIRWYDVAVGGAALATGPAFTTPTITETTSFWVEASTVIGGGTGTGAKEDNSNGEYFNNSDRWLYFDANQEFILDAVKVYTEQAIQRTIGLYDVNGTLLEMTTVSIPNGESFIDLGFTVPVGVEYTLRVDGNANMWRDNDPAGVNYPYDIAGYGSITGANVSADNADDYYYYFYDWQVSLPSLECVSDREEIVVDILISGLDDAGVLGEVSVFPNPTEGMLQVQFGSNSASHVTMELTDLEGRKIQQEVWKAITVGTTQQIDLKSLSKGVYLLRLISEEGQRVERIELR